MTKIKIPVSTMGTPLTEEELKSIVGGMDVTKNIIRKSKFSRTPKRSAQISGFCIKRNVRKSTSAQH